MGKAMDFNGKTVLVTGASRGIGAEVAAQLVRRGAKVVGVARAPFQADGVETICADFADPGAPGQLAEAVARDHPECSALIANAAIMEHTDLTRGNHSEEIAREVRINMTAPVQLAVAMVAQLSGNGGGVINFVTSGLAIAPRAEAAVYCATKAGLRSFARSLRYQCVDAGLDLHVSETIMTLVETTLSRDLGRRYAPARAAADLLAGLEAGRDEIWIERTRLLRVVNRLSPALAHRILRGPNVRDLHSG